MRYTSTVILALAVIAVAALTIVFWPRLTGTGPKPPEAKETHALLENATADDVLAITVQVRGADGQYADRLAIAHQDKVWRLTKPIEYPADDYESRRLARAAVEGEYKQAIDLGGKDAPGLAALGLEEPACRVVVSLKKTEKHEARSATIDVGKKSALGNRLYVRLHDPEKVVVLETDDLLQRAGEDIGMYRSRVLIDLVKDDVARINLEGEKGKTRLDRSEGDEGHWVLSAPLAARADPDVMDKLIGAALNLRVKQFIADSPPDLTRYGLAEPRLTVTLWGKAAEPARKEEPEAAKAAGEVKPPEKTPDEIKETATAAQPPAPVKAVTLKFGSFADLKEKTVHVTADDGASVESVDAEALKNLDKSPEELRDMHVLQIDTARTGSVEVHNGTGTFTLVRKDDQWRLQVPGRAEADADPGAVESLLVEVKALKVLYFKAQPQAGWEVPDDAWGVMIQQEGEAAPRGLRLVMNEKAGSRVRNIREPWVGRFNERDIVWFGKDWLAYLGKKVLQIRPADVQDIIVAAPDRRTRLQRTGPSAWKLTEPIEAEADTEAVDSLLGELVSLTPRRFVAATAGLKPYDLDPGQVVCTLTMKPAAEGAPPHTETVRLAVQPSGEIFGRIDPSDLVFQAEERVLHAVAGEPLSQKLTEFLASDVTGLTVAASGKQMTLLEKGGKWYRAGMAGQAEQEIDAQAAKDIASAVAELKVVRWAAYDTKDLTRFGLASPAIHITAVTEKGETTLLVSDKPVDKAVERLFDRHPARYVMVEGGKYVGIAAGTPMETILQAPKVIETGPPQGKSD